MIGQFGTGPDVRQALFFVVNLRACFPTVVRGLGMLLGGVCWRDVLKGVKLRVERSQLCYEMLERLLD